MAMQGKIDIKFGALDEMLQADVARHLWRRSLLGSPYPGIWAAWQNVEASDLRWRAQITCRVDITQSSIPGNSQHNGQLTLLGTLTLDKARW